MKAVAKKSNVTRLRSVDSVSKTNGRAAGGALLWAGLLRRLDQVDPGYAS